MVRSCHLDTCPVGIATQRPELRAKYAATPEMIETYLLLVAEDVRAHLARLGLRSVAEAVGRTELLEPRATADTRAGSLELKPLLARGGSGFSGERPPESEGGELGELFAADASPALSEARLVDLEYPIANRDRAVGARLGGRIGREFGAHPPPGRVRARFEGAAGQSFGAFLAAGVKVTLLGEANDGVGKSMSGGRIAIAPPEDDLGDPVLIGNAALYGATGGELFCAGRAGERFAVRNSGAAAVVEGTGDHACEYMTGGTVVILGEHGLNLAAGMSGGVIYVYDRARRLPLRLNEQLVEAHRVDGLGPEELRELLERHARYTGSPLAADLLARWENEAGWFWRVAPRPADVAEEAEPEVVAAR
jgi:glutamate synthase domain-containing protein 3